MQSSEKYDEIEMRLTSGMVPACVVYEVLIDGMIFWGCG
jgi:hypothetical protein